MKLLVHLIVFALGAGAGIYYGVKHPESAQQIASSEEIEAAKLKAVAQAKLDTITAIKNHAQGGSQLVPGGSGFVTAPPTSTTGIDPAFLNKLETDAKSDMAKANQELSHSK